MNNDFISLALNYISKTIPSNEIFLVQIGAMDGTSFDDLCGYIDINRWSGFYIEPIQEHFSKLVEYKNTNSNVQNKFAMCAVTDTDGIITMSYIPSDVVTQNGLHPGFTGMSAVNPPRNGFGISNEDKAILEKYGKTISVPSYTLKTLFSLHNIEQIDMLFIDAEGCDSDIIKQFDFTKYKPKIIRIENISLTEDDRSKIMELYTTHGYVYQINGSELDAFEKQFADEVQIEYDKSIATSEISEVDVSSSNKPYLEGDITVVTGLWNIGRDNRPKEFYLQRLEELLKIPNKLIIFIPREFEFFVMERRDPSNTFVKIFELSDIENLLSPFFDKIQKIRTSEEWLSITGEHGWLRTSPQAVNEWYNPIVMSKMMLLHDASIWNPFDTTHFVWIDAGITNTVWSKYFVEDALFDKMIPHLDPFLFLCYPYENRDEIHGFKRSGMDTLANEPVLRVARGGLFGGTKEAIHEANGMYYSLLLNSLSSGYMGTEESIFSIMTYLNPETYRIFMLESNGLIVKYAADLIQGIAKLEEIPEKRKKYIRPSSNSRYHKIDKYVLTFNFPEQLNAILNNFAEVGWDKTRTTYILDNSTDERSRWENKRLAEMYNAVHIPLEGNTGICGGRMYAATHFHRGDAEYYFFFEDDMMLHTIDKFGLICRNGLQLFVPDLYDKVMGIMYREQFDFLKLSFTEVYMDNNIQVSWYNVPQSVRTEIWPDYDKLPVTGLDPNCPRTKFDRIDSYRDLAYITGQIYYANWPMVMNRAGNKKVFIETQWKHPFEQTWMSYVFQKTREGYINPAVLLASPVNHNRIAHYTPEERREN
jgi:FkbM family methyltransferase